MKIQQSIITETVSTMRRDGISHKFNEANRAKREQAEARADVLACRAAGKLTSRPLGQNLWAEIRSHEDQIPAKWL